MERGMPSFKKKVLYKVFHSSSLFIDVGSFLHFVLCHFLHLLLLILFWYLSLSLSLPSIFVDQSWLINIWTKMVKRDSRIVANYLQYNHIYRFSHFGPFYLFSKLYYILIKFKPNFTFSACKLAFISIIKHLYRPKLITDESWLLQMIFAFLLLMFMQTCLFFFVICSNKI